MERHRTGRAEETSVSRRTWARLAVWGAIGLSLLRRQRQPPAQAQARGTTCYLVGPRRDGPEADRLYVERWSRLGRLWREIGAHKRRDASAPNAGPEEFDRLHSEIIDALNDASAWWEVRALFEERWHHVSRVLYGPVPDHTPPPGGLPAARAEIERQVQVLEDLRVQGKLGRKAVRKAARALAVQAEFFVRLRAPKTAEHPGEPAGARQTVLKRYESGRLKPRWPAALAGRRMVELTVDRLGMLTARKTD